MAVSQGDHMSKSVLPLIFATLMFCAACSKGVPVPDSFPVKITLPAGSEIIDNGMIDEGAAAGFGSVSFSCKGSEDSVKKHIAAQLKSKGYTKWSVPGMDAMPGMGEMYNKEGSRTIVSLSSGPDVGQYMLMAMEMPDMSGFQP